jgi:SAM-dependent methyltransferase
MVTMNSMKIKCRMCNSSNLNLFLDLGHVPKVDTFLSFDEINQPETTYPLNVYLCQDCGLSQLGYLVPATELFNETYAYESSTTQSRRENHCQLADYVCNTFNIKKNSLVVDIGSNVGVLLECFKKNDMTVMGVDASSNIVKKANLNGIETILGFFSESIVSNILKTNDKASVICATNVFAHIQDYESFILALKKLLVTNGIFVFQVPHFLRLLENTEYDTIYHEHISYFGLKPLIKFFSKHDLELFDVIETDIDGGSIRCFVSNKGQYPLSSNVSKILDEEEKNQIYSLDKLHNFADTVKQQKQELIELLVQLKKENKKVVGVGAPAKGITMINYCKIDSDLLDYITEKAPLKIDKFTPGMHIPIVSDTYLLKDMPDYALIFAWNFSKEIIKNLKSYQDKGGKFIIPIPRPKIT